MNLSLVSTIVIFATLGSFYSQVDGKPVEANSELDESQAQKLVERYEALKLAIINDLGYSKEFADMVEINLKRAIKEEMERQRLLAQRLRQQNPVGDEAGKVV